MSDNTQQQSQFTKEEEDYCKSVLKKKDYYEILGLEKTSNDDEIKKAYRKLALKLHPDRNKAPSSTEAFKKLSQAYVCLSDPEKRRNYDQFGSEEEYRQKFQSQSSFYREDFNPQDIFKMFFQNFGGEGDDMGDMFFNNMFGPMNGRPYQRAHRGHSSSEIGREFQENMFGGTSKVFRMPGGSTFVYQTSFGGGNPFMRQNRERGRRQQEEQGNRDPRRQPPEQDIADQIKKDIKSGCTKMFQILVMIGFIYYFMLQPSSPTYFNHSLTPSSAFPHEVTTHRLGLKYYVNDKTLDQMKKNAGQFTKFEKEYEDKIYQKTQQECELQHKKRNRLINLANSSNGDQRQSYLNQAMNISLESCTQQEDFDRRKSMH